MAIYKEDIVDINLETGNIHRSFLGRSIGTADSGADHFGVRVFRDGAAVSLSGVSVQGYFRDSHGNNIAITSGNSVSGNVAKVVLPQACYNYEGQFVLAIKLVGGGVTGTVRIVDGVVDNTNTGGAVAPTGTVPTYQEVLAIYNDMTDAVNSYEEVVEEQDQKIDDLERVIYVSNTELFGGVGEGFPLAFENGTYQNITVGYPLVKYYEGGYNLTRKVVKSTTYTPPCNTIIKAKDGYSFTVFYATNGIITGSTNLITEYTMLPGQQYGMTLRATNGTDNISNVPAESIIEIEYTSNLDIINDTLNSKIDKLYNEIAETFDNALTDRSAIKNAIFKSGWYDIKAEGNAISEIKDSSSYVSAVLPVEFGDYVYVNAEGGGSESAGARTYAFTDGNGTILKRADWNERVSRYLIAPTGSKYFYVQNDLSNLSTGYYAYVGYNILQKRRNIKKFENGSNVFANYAPGYYSSTSNNSFPYPNQTQSKMESMLISVEPGEVYFIKGRTNDPSIQASFPEAIIFDSLGNVLKAWTSKVNEYIRAICIPENGAYLATNTNYEYEKACVSKYNDFNCFVYTNTLTQWVSGGINDGTGAPTDNNKRIRNKLSIAIYRGKKIEMVLPDGYVGLVYKYGGLENYIGYQTPWSNKIKFADIPDNTHYIIVVIKSVNSPDADISDKVSYIAENTIVREETKTEEIEIKDVQEITTAINFYPDDITTGKTIDANGDEVSDASYKVTDFVKIPKKYNKLLLYTHAFSESGDAPVVAFYDETMTFIEKITTGTDCITNDDTYVYARAVFPVADTKCDLSFTNETIKPDYAPPKKYLLFTNDLNSYGRNVNSDGAVGAIINTGLKYLGDERFGYGTEHTAFAEECIKTTKDTHTESSDYEGERYQMDCSTYVMLMMMGIAPECSRYFYTKNIPSNWGYRFNRLVEYEGYVYGVAQTGDTKRLYANSIASYAYKNGYLFLINDDLSNIRPGDIFFLSNQGASYNFFENIGHCGMVVDSIQMENGGRTIVTFEGNGGSTSPCKYHTYTSRSDTMVYAARFPMPFVHNDAINIAEFSEEITTALSGSSGNAIDIATVEISKPLENGKVFTVCVKCDLPDNCYLMLKANGMSHLGVANENILKRPDGYRTFHIFAKNTDTISTTESITLQAKCTGSVSGSAVLSMIRVYDGFVSPEFT